MGNKAANKHTERYNKGQSRSHKCKTTSGECERASEHASLGLACRRQHVNYCCCPRLPASPPFGHLHLWPVFAVLYNAATVEDAAQCSAKQHLQAWNKIGGWAGKQDGSMA